MRNGSSWLECVVSEDKLRPSSALWEKESGCEYVMHLIAGARGAMAGLMAEVVMIALLIGYEAVMMMPPAQ